MKGTASPERVARVVVGPVGWPMVRLRDVATFAHGSTPSKANRGYWNGVVPWVSPKDFRAQRLSDAQDHISETAIDEGEAVVATPGSVLVVVRSGILKRRLPVAIVDVRLTFNQDVKSILPAAGRLRAEYLALMLRAAEPLVVQDGVKVGPTVHSIKSGYLENFSIPLPPLAEQERIAGRLTEQLAAVERARGAAKERLAAAESLPAAYLREVFEGPEASGVSTRFGDVCEVVSGFAWSAPKFNRKGRGLPVIRIQNVDAVSDRDFLFWEHEYADRFLVREGELLLTLSGSFRVAVWVGPRALLNQRVVKLVPTPGVDTGWLLHALRIRLSEIEQLGKDALVSNVSINDIRDLILDLPPLPDQRRTAADLAARLAGAERLAEGIRAELAAVDALPAALLREAFNAGGTSE